jgi:hypothetical protein
MDMLIHLWLPIVASAAAVWMASAIAWTALPHHKGDHKRLPDEAGFTAALRPLKLAPGNYLFPYCEHNAQRKDPEFVKRFTEGPTGIISLWGPMNMNMGRNMGLSFLVYLVVSVLIGYLGAATLKPGADHAHVFQVLGTAGVLGYSFAFLPGGIWFGQYPRAMVMGVLDGIAYGLITGGVFALLWPGM